MGCTIYPDGHFVSNDKFHLAIKSILSLIAVSGGIAFAAVLAYNTPGKEVFWPTSQYSGITWMICGILLALTLIFFLRITRVSWFWSIFGGTIAIVIYSIFVKFIIELLIAFLAGFLLG